MRIKIEICLWTHTSHKSHPGCPQSEMVLMNLQEGFPPQVCHASHDRLTSVILDPESDMASTRQTFLVTHMAGDMAKQEDQQSGPLPGSHLGTGAA